LALAVVATGYWGTVAWLSAMRSAGSVMPANDPIELGVDTLPPEENFHFEGGGGRGGWWTDPNYVQPGMRVLGLSFGTPPMVLTDIEDDGGKARWITFQLR
jgi:hypothetical protein